MIPRDGQCDSLWQHTGELYQSGKLVPGEHYDVVIVGGGITGMATALQLQRAGKRCIVVEAHNLCFGTTGGTTAHLNTLLDTPYYTIAKNFGKENAILVAHATKEAIALVKDNIAAYQVDCGFADAAGYVYAQDAKQESELEDIQVSATEAGVVVNTL